MYKEYLNKFKTQYRVNLNNGCWEWRKINLQGYGRFHFNGTSMFAHRFSYELFKGTIPENLLIRHLCNNPRCVNPKHLEIGTQQDNMNDKVSANRQAKGGKHGMAVLDEKQVVEIYQSSESNYVLANLYKVTPQMISYIRSNKSWTDLTGHLNCGRVENRGQDCKESILTEEQARYVLQSSEPHTTLALKFGVSNSTIWDLRNNKTWKHLDRCFQVTPTKGVNPSKGELHGMARLDVEKVKKIKSLFDSKTNNEIARIFDVAPSTISAIKTGRVWKNVTPD